MEKSRKKRKNRNGREKDERSLSVGTERDIMETEKRG